MSAEFYFRREKEDSEWQIQRVGSCSSGPISYRSSRIKNTQLNLSEKDQESYKDWLNAPSNTRKRLFQKYSKMPDSNCFSGIYFVGVNFEMRNDAVFQTVPQTPQLNAMCDFISTQAVYLGPLNIPEDMACGQSSPNKTKKGNTMYYDDDECDCTECRADKLAPEKRYLLNRTNSIESIQRCKIPATYHLEDDPMPMTANDLLQRIKDGKFVVRKDKGDEVGNWPYQGTTFIEWRDPAVTKDIAGADKAREALETAVTKTMDTIVASDVAAGLSAVQALEAQTF